MSVAPLDYDNHPFTIAELAAHLNYSRQYISKLMRTGKLKFSKVGSRVTIRGKNVRAMLDAAEVVKS